MTLPTENADESLLQANSFGVIVSSREQCLTLDDRLLYPPKEEGMMPKLDSPEAPQVFHESPLDAAKECRVCGDVATGMYFGALVCVPCKTFFLRYAGDGFCYECKYNKNCEITIATRTQCKYCRYQKCLRIGMCRRVRPIQVEALEGQQLCVVCQDVANGVHFGVLTCEGCKKFFRRGLTEQKSYRCRNNQNCAINPSNRNSCRFCRFKKCLEAGMSRDAIQMGRPSKMPAFEMVHQKSRIRENEKNAKGPKHISLAFNQSSIYATSPATGTSTSGERSIEFVPRSSSSRLPSVPQRFPSWTQDAVPPHSVEQSNGIWNDYENLSATRQKWSINRTKVSHTKTTIEEAERDRIAFPDSTVAREESDTFLPNMRDSITSSVDWNREDYFHDWTEMADSIRSVGPLIGFRESLQTGICKVEALSSDDEGPSGLKRSRFDRLASDYHLQGDPQREGSIDVQGKHLLSSGKIESFPGMDQTSNDDEVHSSSELWTSFENRESMVNILKRSLTNVFCVPIVNDQRPFLRVCTSPYASTHVTRYGEACIGSPSITSSGCLLELKTAAQSERNELQSYLHTVPSSAEQSHKHACIRDSISEKKTGTDEDEQLNEKETADQCSKRPDADNHETSEEEIGSQCWHTIQRIIPAYHRFVTMGTTINQQLKEAYEKWKKENMNSGKAEELSSWIQTTVVPAYTTVSIAYCKSLPDFTHLNANDQRTLIASGQSQSRILVAALHWYDAVERRFRNFLSWREDARDRRDSFKEQLRQFADHITTLRIDPIEAALLNALAIFSTDYLNLTDRRAIETIRSKIRTTMKAYTTANNASPNSRMEDLQEVLIQSKELGLLHVALTTTRSLGIATSTPSATLAQPDTEVLPEHCTSEHDQGFSEISSGQTQSGELECSRDRQLVAGQLTSGNSSDKSLMDGELTSDRELLTVKQTNRQSPSNELQTVHGASRRPRDEDLQNTQWADRQSPSEMLPNANLINRPSPGEELQIVQWIDGELKDEQQLGETRSPFTKLVGEKVSSEPSNT